jgi:hypothetical protein
MKRLVEFFHLLQRPNVAQPLQAHARADAVTNPMQSKPINIGRLFTMVAIAVGVVGVGFIGVAAVLWMMDSPAHPQAAQERQDASDIVACRDYRHMLADLQAGVLTDGEVRKAVQRVRENAKLADSAEIREASDIMLRTLTSGTPEEATEAILAFGITCSSVNGI